MGASRSQPQATEEPCRQTSSERQVQVIDEPYNSHRVTGQELEQIFENEGQQTSEYYALPNIVDNTTACTCGAVESNVRESFP